MPFGYVDTFTVPPLPSGWGNPLAAKAPMADARPSYHNDIEKKKQFGIELAKRNNKPNAAFLAGCAIFGDDTNAALWVSREWLTDQIVLEAREKQLETVDAKDSLLDKDQFASKVLELAEAKNLAGTHYLFDDKERVALLKLYAEIRGFAGNNKFDPSTIINNNNTINSMRLILVRASNNNQDQIIENSPNSNTQIVNEKPAVRLKLV